MEWNEIDTNHSADTSDTYFIESTEQTLNYYASQILFRIGADKELLDALDVKIEYTAVNRTEQNRILERFHSKTVLQKTCFFRSLRFEHLENLQQVLKTQTEIYDKLSLDANR